MLAISVNKMLILYVLGASPQSAQIVKPATLESLAIKNLKYREKREKKKKYKEK